MATVGEALCLILDIGSSMSGGIENEKYASIVGRCRD
jgi:hypothetical protein